jgi:hypothetical protein
MEQGRYENIMRRLRSRLLRRMQDYGPRHRLSIEATELNIRMRERYDVTFNKENN